MNEYIVIWEEWTGLVWVRRDTVPLTHTQALDFHGFLESLTEGVRNITIRNAAYE